MSGRLFFLATSPRMPPGLLSWPAWQALRTGDVLAGDPGHPQLAHLREAGVAYSLIKPSGHAERAQLLFERAGGGGTVIWLADPDGDAELLQMLGAMATTGDSDSPEFEVVHGSYDLPGARLLDVVTTMDRLRAPGGCPWDREQTHASLTPYLLEEAYEVVETVETGDLHALPDELGDVLLQVAFHSRVAEERDDGTGFTIDEVARGIVDKLVRRHPHVFGDVRVSDADEVTTNWDAIKAKEREEAGEESSVFAGIPFGQPALSLAYGLQKRAARAGLPTSLDELASESAVDADEAAAEIGAELFATVARARAAGIDPEAALRATARAFRDQGGS